MKFWLNLLFSIFILSRWIIISINHFGKFMYLKKIEKKYYTIVNWKSLNLIIIFFSFFIRFERLPLDRKFLDALKRYNISSRDWDTEKSLSTRVTLANSLSMLNTAEKISHVEIGRKRENLLVAWTILTDI